MAMATASQAAAAAAAAAAGGGATMAPAESGGTTAASSSSSSSATWRRRRRRGGQALQPDMSQLSLSPPSSTCTSNNAHHQSPQQLQQLQMAPPLPPPPPPLAPPPPPHAVPAGAAAGDVERVRRLERLSGDVEALLLSVDDSGCYSDAELVTAEGIRVPVHRCLLAARSPFFRRIFARKSHGGGGVGVGGGGSGGGGSGKRGGNSSRVVVDLTAEATALAAGSGGGGSRKIGRGVLRIALAFCYGGRLPQIAADAAAEEEGVRCMDASCPHCACPPVVEFNLELLCAAAMLELAELQEVAQQRLVRQVAGAQPHIVLQVMAAAAATRGCDALRDACAAPLAAEGSVSRVAIQRSGLPPHLARNLIRHRRQLIRQRRRRRQEERGGEAAGALGGGGGGGNDVDGAADMECDDAEVEGEVEEEGDRVTGNVYRALDSDDVELTRLLLAEGSASVDSTLALHYAAAYCDVATFRGMVDALGGDVEARDEAGHTVLHVAALRRDPQLIGTVLDAGAYPHEVTTRGGLTALHLARRHARDLSALPPAEQREEWLRDGICCEILEQAGHANPRPVFPDAAAAGLKELRMRLLYLENRVAFARLLWPREAKVVLGLSQVEVGKEEYHMDLNKEPDKQQQQQEEAIKQQQAAIKQEPADKERLVERVRALQRAIEVGHRFFPRCTAILNHYMDDGSFEHAIIQNRRVPDDMQLQEIQAKRMKFAKAFQRDVEERHHSSSCCTRSSAADFS